MTEPDVPVSAFREQLREYSLRERAISEAPFGITIADIREEDQPLIFANDGFLQLTGYTEDEILGRNCRFLQGENTSPEPVGAMREAIDDREPVQVELRNYRKDGTEFWCEVTLAPIENDRGEVTHYVGFQQDVSARKAFEMQLKEQRDDLTVLNEMVRHDIRNDLQVALAALELFQATAEAPPNPQIETAIESIHQAVGLTNTAKEVADVMLETGGDYKPTALAPVIEAEIEDCRSSYPDASISVAGTLPRVTVEANELLHSIVRNLLVNAVSHNPTEQPNVRVSAWTHEGEVLVTVADDGPGVPESARDDIFQKGWTGDRSSGTGIGLNIVSRLAENYGGDITLLREGETPPGRVPDESADLGGATFLLRLPLAG